MVYKTWSYHFSKNWHFYAIIAVLAVGVAYLSQKVYRLNKEIASKKTIRRRKEETRDHYSRDYDVEAGSGAGKSDFTEEKVNEDEMFDDGEPIEIVTEKLKQDTPDENKPIKEEQVSNSSVADDDFEKNPSAENSVDEDPVEEKNTPVEEKKETPPTCIAQIKSGKRKGEVCGKPAMTGINTCRFHT
jgi:hypothetical protein